MKTQELAEWLDIGTSTLRLWTLREYKSYFSESARGGSGRTRNFTDRDARIAAHIARLKNEGHSSDEVHVALKTLQEGDWQGLPEMPAAPPEFEPISMIPREAAETRNDLQRARYMREIAALEDRVDQLTDELKAERASKEEIQRELAQTRESLGELRGRLQAIESERRSIVFWLTLIAGIIIFTGVAVYLLLAVL